MTAENLAAGVSQWATTSGFVWARRWRDTDAGLAGLSPHLLAAIKAAAPDGSFRAFDIGCGPGTTTLDVAAECAGAEIVACDVSHDLAEIAKRRSSDLPNVRVVVGDAQDLATREGPFDLFFSRHGVMFFADPVQAFRSFRNAAQPDASLTFSCFQSWDLNPWASELASAAAGRALPLPGREPSGFAFADPDYVNEIFESSGWTQAKPLSVTFDYVAGQGAHAVEDALSFFCELGPSSRLLESLPEEERRGAVDRMRSVIERHHIGGTVTFQAAAWIWSAKAADA